MSAPGAASPPAGFWPRYAAWSLDAVLIAALTCLLGAGHWRRLIEQGSRAHADLNARLAEAMASSASDDLAFGGFLGRLGEQPQVHAAATAATSAWIGLVLGWLLVYAALGLLYEVGFVAFTPWRATPGKRALGLYVAARDGGELGPVRAALRYLGGSLSWLTLNLGHLLAAGKPEHLALHDRLAGASVRRRGAARMPAWGWAWLVLQVAATLAACVWLMWTLQASLDAALNGAL
ncbi:RDD family protein [Lysobacter sp. K5869]|uniref:RDD family protein n=1 Tax=Lysobacter sp. K5869 TaxID=2820808 RepID=UPI001C060DB9|nr:RDD family protein [Lysobacter sp. K5869]QWP77404.1 RDD family protein [Lysobacter sp. K5869]